MIIRNKSTYDPRVLRPEFLLRPDIVFLNHGSFGACPRSVFDSYQAWQVELERQPVEFLGRRFDALMRDARVELAAFLGADPDELVYVPNATFGLNVVARSLPLHPGDTIITTDHEYGALDRVWQFVCKRSGARYVRMQLPLPLNSAGDVVETVWAGVTERTRVIFISHITSPTALVLPVAELITRARAAGIITVIDGAHAPGQIPLDLQTLGADFYVGNCHKWMLSPKGAGFLYARQEMQPLLQPLVISWGAERNVDSGSSFIDEHEYQGTRDLAACLAVPDAIRFMERHHWPEVRHACHNRVRYAAEQITGLTGIEPLAPVTDEWYAQMCSLPLPTCDAVALKRRLYDEFGIEVPIVTWQERQFVRVSLQAYNLQSDVDALVHALEVLLPQVTTQGQDPSPLP